MSLTRYDKAFICILLILALLIFIGGLTALGSNKRGNEVVILVNGREAERCSLNLKNPKTIRVEGILGESLIEIANGKVRMLFSPCSNHNCMARGWINKPGDIIVCVPNRVVVKVVGDNARNEVDVFNG